MFRGMIGAVAAAAALLLAVQPGAAHAAEQRTDRPEIFRKLVDCRAIADATQRLACYDEQVSALDAAEAKQDVVVVDRGQIKKARRSLFGLTLPTLSIFGNRDGEEKQEEGDGFTEIEATIERASFNAGINRWIIILDDGARWVQSDTRDIPRSPKPGMKIKIRKAAMGSYLANIDGQIAIRVRREN